MSCMPYKQHNCVKRSSHGGASLPINLTMCAIKPRFRLQIAADVPGGSKAAQSPSGYKGHRKTEVSLGSDSTVAASKPDHRMTILNPE
jgi:hypothetical protein